MIWRDVELFNVNRIEEQSDGSLRLYRFPVPVSDVFAKESDFVKTVGEMTTGCEIRFVGEEVDITLSSDCNGLVEIYRGDFFCRVEYLTANEKKHISLRSTVQLDRNKVQLDKSVYQGRFAHEVWRVVFGHDICITLHSVETNSSIRPPKAEELPQKKLLAYGSSITHSACSIQFTNSYIYTVGKFLGVDVLCKGMGGSCFCQKEVADYIAEEDWDIVTLELGVNMVATYPVEEFERRATYVVKRALERGKPVVMIGIFTNFSFLPNGFAFALNKAYVECFEKIYQTLKCENLYYICGRDIVTDWDYLTTDLIHPSPYGHGEMGRKIAKKIREEFQII